jgi:hypothetical protein
MRAHKRVKHKYKIGETVTLQIGTRPLLHIKVLERVMRAKKAHYLLNWALVGYHELLNTVAIPEHVLNKNQQSHLPVTTGAINENAFTDKY